MRPIFTAMILVLAGLTGSASAQGADFRLEFFAEIRGLADAGQYDTAERLVEEAFLGNPGAPPDDRIELLDTLTELQTASGKFADAGDTLWNKATLVARVSGPEAPDLGAVYAASGRAYAQAGAAARAVAGFEAALLIDRLYLPCDGPALAGLYEDLAAAYAAAGRADDADRALALAGDADARCAENDPTRSVAAADTAEEGEFALVELFYATDRAATGETRPNEFFGAGRGTLSYGQAVVSIPRVHKPGKIEAPSLLTFNWQENPALHVVLMDVDPMHEDAFFGAIGAALGPGKSDEIFLFIHGFNVTFDGAAKRTAQMAYDLNFNGIPMFYSWPSRGRTGSYMADAASVQVSARHLTGFLEDLVARSGGKRIEIVAHSMGNRALTEALEIYALRHPKAENVFDQIIFAAPDVDSALFVYQTDVFAQLARRMTLYTSDADLALSTSKQLHGNPRAGLASDDTPLVGAAFDTIDMSGVGAGLLNHNYYAADASALSDMLWLFWRNPPPPSRCGMAEELGEDRAHWIYLAEECDSSVLLTALSLAQLGADAAMALLDRRVAELEAQGGMAELLGELARVRQALLDLLAG